MTAPATSRERAFVVVLQNVSVSVAVGVAVMLSTLVSLVPSSAGAIAPGATIAVPGTTTPLITGGSATAFTVALPLTSACPGDTAKDGNHVYSYLVHQGVDVGALTFVNAPSSGFGLVNAAGNYYGPVNTAMGTGEIIEIPNDFTWAPLVTAGGGSVTLAQLLYQGKSGAWETGLACADTHGALNTSWNVPVTFTASSSDPMGFVWTVDEPGPPAPTTGGSATHAQATPVTTSTQPPAGALATPSRGTGSGTVVAAGSGQNSSAAVPPAADNSTQSNHESSATGSATATADKTGSSWIAPLGLAILAVVLGVGIVWLARRKRATVPTKTESVR